MDKANNGKPVEPSPVSLLEFRKRAEKIIRTAETYIDISPEEAQKVLHELCVNQIELGMQNEELCRVQVELETARMRYFDLYDLAPVGYCTVSEQGLITEANLTAASLLKTPRNALVNRPLSQFIVKEDQNIYFMRRKQLLESGEPQSYELRMKKKDGTMFWGHLTAIIAQETDGATVCRIVLSDISELKQTEEALRQSELELREVLDVTADGILAVDSQGKAIKMNRRFVELWRIPQVLAGRGDDQSMLNFVLDQLSDPDAFLKKVQSLYGSLNYDMDTLNFKDGRVFERYSAPLMQDSALIGRVWSFRDITERKQAEKAIKLKNSELLKLNTEKDKLFSIIAHDLRSPLSAFIGLTEVMATADLPMSEMQSLSVNMKNSAENLFGLLEGLLNWARMQQGLIPFKPAVIELRPSVDESIGTALESAKNKGIEITCDIPSGMTVFADSNMLQTVIRNLVSNAIKFTTQGGKITLSAQVATDKSVEISVKDSGIGMSSEIVNNLFRLDAQTNRKGTEGEPSTGLGLLLCKEFVEKHDGKIWEESEEGKGTTFYFTLPGNTEAKTEAGTDIQHAAPAAAKEHQIKPLKILVVEDDEESEILIELEVKGFAREVFKAANGAAAVEICRNNPDLDLALMDIAMPEMDGYEATRQIRQFNQKVIIIAQTACALGDDREDAIAAGCNDYIAKPYDKSTLSALLKKWF